MFLMFDGVSLSESIVTGFLFGLFIAVTLGIIDYLFRRSSGGKIGGRVKQQQEIIIQRPFNETVNLCRKSIEKYNGKKLTTDPTEGIIQGRIGVSWQSWGEKIMIKLDELNSEETVVTITSKPLLPTTVIDYGKNKRNITRLTKYIETYSE